MHKLHKFCSKFTNEIVVSTRSTYYQFGGQILRISDHIGINSSGNFSLIISGDTYLLHSHKSGEIAILTYEQVKQFIKTISLCSKVLSPVNISDNWKLPDTETLVVSPSLNTRSYLEQVKLMYWGLTAKKRKRIRSHLGITGMLTSDSDFIRIGKSSTAKRIFIDKYGTYPK